MKVVYQNFLKFPSMFCYLLMVQKTWFGALTIAKIAHCMAGLDYLFVFFFLFFLTFEYVSFVLSSSDGSFLNISLNPSQYSLLFNNFLIISYFKPRFLYS